MRSWWNKRAWLWNWNHYNLDVVSGRQQQWLRI